jgi:TctA family transporter
MVEENLRRAMVLSRGDPAVFFTRPISLVFILVTLFLIVLMITPAIRKKREQAYASTEEDTT